jgi:hypothetical protein
MIVYQLRTAYDKNGDSKYAWFGVKDASLVLHLQEWQFFGTWEIDPVKHCIVNPTNECWTKPYGNIWPNPGLELEYQSKKKRGDFEDAGGFLIFTKRCIELLDDYIDPQKGEFLPVVCSERDDLIIYRPLNCLDAIDEEKIGIQQNNFPPQKFKERVNFEYYYFRENVIDDTPMFIVPSHLSTNTFVTDKFLQRVKNLKLKGFGFQPLWSSELGPLCDHCHNPLCPEGADINL